MQSKRIFDIVFSCLGILICLPFGVLIGIVIKIDSKGPVFYKAKRVGLKEKEFVFYKYRTMRPNSDKFAITVGNRDDRITNFGYFLRKTKLDEIPQLINVLKGDISFVGPRPDVSAYKEEYKKHYQSYYSFKPGITSYSSIYFRNESELYKDLDDPESEYINKTIPQKVMLDKEYFDHISLITDIRIILKTFSKLLRS